MSKTKKRKTKEKKEKKEKRKTKENEDALKVITVNVFTQHIDVINKLVYEYGLFSSRSEVVRYCMKKAIPVILDEIVRIKSFLANDDVNNVTKTLKEFGWNIRRRNVVAKQPKIEIDKKMVDEFVKEFGVEQDYLTRNGIKIIRKLDNDI